MEMQELMLSDRHRYSTDLVEDVMKQYYVSHDPVLFIYELVGNYGHLRMRHDPTEWHETWQQRVINVHQDHLKRLARERNPARIPER